MRLVTGVVGSFLTVCAAGLGLQQSAGTAASSPKAEQTAVPIAVVELFTSEGCSSCPPADDVLSDLAKRHTAGVYLVAFHVDYWDYLGWKDPFASAEATRRQREYGEAKSLRSIYTPHMFVNGGANFVGSDRSRAEHEIDAALKSDAKSTVAFSVTRSSERVVVSPTVGNAPEYCRVVGVLVQDGLVSKPTRGENSGRTLRHDRVARAFGTFEPSAASRPSITLTIPPDARGATFDALVWIENTDTKQIVGAAMMPVPAPQEPSKEAQTGVSTGVTPK